MSDVLTATVGWSDTTDAHAAGTAAAERAIERLSPMKAKLAIVFGSSWFNQLQLLQGVRSVLGQVPIAGESTAGEIVSRGPMSHSCAVLLIASDALTCSVGLGEQVDRAPREAGRQAASTAMREFAATTRVGVLVFGDGLVTNFGDVLRGLQEIVGTSALIVGGLAGDDLDFAKTYQYCNHRVVSQAVVGVLIGGPVKIGVGIDHGFAPISKPRRITRSQATTLYELDRQPAASVYEEYLGHEVVQRMRREGLTRLGIAYPLGIQGETTEDWLLRNVVSFGDDGSLTCSGEVVEGSWLQLMIGNKRLAIEAASRAVRHAIQPLDRVGCVLVFDSAIRRKLLGFEHAAKEIAEIQDAVGPSTPLVGCYTYGEQATLGTAAASERTAIQTGSVLVVALGT